MTSIPTDRVTHPVVKSALEAWQARDLAGWLAHFTRDPSLYDDGNPRDFQSFSREIGEERFVSIDRVEEGGTRITGRFHSDT